MPLSQCAIRQGNKLLCCDRCQLESSPTLRIRVQFRGSIRAVLCSFAVVFGTAAFLLLSQSASGQERPDAPSATRDAQSKQGGTGGFFSTLNHKSIVFPDIATN